MYLIQYVVGFILSLIIFCSTSIYAAPTSTALGFPSVDAAQQARDDKIYQSAVTAYRFWYPTVSTEAIFEGNRNAGIKDNQAMAILSAEPHHIGFTFNSDTPYGAAVLDLTDGPMVIELPAGPYIALVNDHHQRWIIDMGLPGPDKGRGGKYLILPPNYQGKKPEGYYVKQADSFKVLFAIRALPMNGDMTQAMKDLQSIKIYRLTTNGITQPSTFVNVTHKNMDNSPLRWETNLQYWEKLHQIVNYEPIINEFRPMYGVLATLGIEKGKLFNPDPRTKTLLERAAKAGHEQMLTAAFASSRPDRIAWPNRKWEWVGLVPDNADFETKTDLDFEARDRWFAQAIVASPAMFRRTVDAGSLYWLGLRDAQGLYLDGRNTYKLSIPLPVPAHLFWSVTVYDASTRSEIKTDQAKAALRSLIELKSLTNAATVDLYFSPTPPSGKEAVWIKTIPGNHWFAYFRIYGPEQAAFNGSWQPGDFEKIA